MTFIVVPHGGRDLNTRSLEVSYLHLRAAAILLALVVLAWVAMAASWAYMSSNAARVPGLTAEVTRLQGEMVKVQELEVALRTLEGQYGQVRTMLGADRNAGAGAWERTSDGADWNERDLDAGAAAIPGSWPLTETGFVTREHYGQFPGQHPGIDIAVGEGTYVRAAASGVVSEAGEDAVYGKYVRIRHSEGYETVYGHASELFVVPDEAVERNEAIALSGNTGTSTAPHLHFEIWKDGEAIDPRQLVTAP
jgi:murein DD-endopeptidase MepM/ murein hydrolase activator NlpD